MAKCQPEAFWSWMVPTGTLDRGGYMGGRCVALTWSCVVDGRLAGQIGHPTDAGATGRTSGVSAPL